jgi:hypothetical protein
MCRLYILWCLFLVFIAIFWLFVSIFEIFVHAKFIIIIFMREKFDINNPKILHCYLHTKMFAASNMNRVLILPILQMSSKNTRSKFRLFFGCFLKSQLSEKWNSDCFLHCCSFLLLLLIQKKLFWIKLFRFLEHPVHWLRISLVATCKLVILNLSTTTTSSQRTIQVAM